MGRIIKDAAPSDVESASVDEEPLTDDDPRIPAEAVSTEETAESEDPSADPTPQGGILPANRARTSEDPVSIEPAPAEPDATGTTAAPPDDPDDGAPASPPDDETDAPNVPSRTDAEWQEHLEEAVEAARAEGYEEGRTEGYETGYDEGYADAETKLQEAYEEKRTQLVEDLRRLDALWDEYMDEQESMLVDLALQLAETIVDAPLTDALRHASEEALLEAVHELSAAPPVTVTVHPVDHQRLRESGLADRLDDLAEDITLESDPDYDEGDWSVSSPTGVIRRLRREVVETLRSELRRASDPPASGAPTTT